MASEVLCTRWTMVLSVGIDRRIDPVQRTAPGPARGCLRPSCLNKRLRELEEAG